MQTKNTIQVSLPKNLVVELYTCHEHLPSWSPGFLSFTILNDGTETSPPTYRQRYVAMGREIEEVLTLIENTLPDGFTTVSDNGGKLRRVSQFKFEKRGENTTQITVRNTFKGEYSVHLIEEDLQAYTQNFLERFKEFAENRIDETNGYSTKAPSDTK